MEEYKFEIRGREDLLTPTGTGEAGMLCWCHHYNDGRIGEIEQLVSQVKGKITSRGCFFTPVVGKREREWISMLHLLQNN